MQTRKVLALRGAETALGTGPLAKIAETLVSAMEAREDARMEKAWRAQAAGAGPHLAVLRRKAQEYAAQNLEDMRAPAVMVLDLHAMLRAASRTDAKDRGLARVATHTYHLMMREPDGVLTVGDVAKLRNHYTREFPKSAIKEVFDNELPKIAFNTLPISNLTHIAAGIAREASGDITMQEAFENGVRVHGLDGNAPAQRRARAFVRGLLTGVTEEEDLSKTSGGDLASRVLAHMEEIQSPHSGEPMVVELETPDEHAEEDESEALDLGEDASELDESQTDISFVEDESDPESWEVLGQLEDFGGDMDLPGDEQGPMLDDGPVDDTGEQTVIMPDPTAPGKDVEVSVRAIDAEPELAPDEPEPDLDPDEDMDMEGPEEDDMSMFAVFACVDGKEASEPLDVFKAASMAIALRRVARFGVCGNIIGSPNGAHRTVRIAVDGSPGEQLIIRACKAFEPKLSPQPKDVVPGISPAIMKSGQLSAAGVRKVCASLELTPQEIERRLLIGEKIEKHGWSLEVNDDADLELRLEGGQARVSAMQHMDDTIATFMSHVAHETPIKDDSARYNVTARFAVKCAACHALTEYLLPSEAVDIECSTCGVPTPAQRIAQTFTDGNPITGYVLLTDVPGSKDPRDRALNAKRLLAAIRNVLPSAEGQLTAEAQLQVGIDDASEGALNRVRRVLEDRYGIKQLEFERAAQMDMAAPMPDAGPEATPPMPPAADQGLAVPEVADQIGDSVSAEEPKGADRLAADEAEAIRAALTHYRNQGVGPMVALDQLSSQYKDLFERYGEKTDHARHMIEADAMRIAAEVWTRTSILTEEPAAPVMNMNPVQGRKGRPSGGKSATGLDPGKVNTQQPDAVPGVPADLGPQSDAEDLIPEPKVNTSVPPKDKMSDTDISGDAGDGKLSAPKPKAEHPATDQKGVKLPPTDMGKDMTGDTKTTKSWDGVSSHAGK